MKIKIELDFSKSNYKYNFMGATYVFSSEFNQRRFATRIEDYIKSETYKLKYNYGGVNINFDLFLSFALYKKLEKRGFRIYTDDNIELKEDTLFLIAYKQTGKHF